jgi:hypothetical protein
LLFFVFHFVLTLKQKDLLVLQNWPKWFQVEVLSLIGKISMQLSIRLYNKILFYSNILFFNYNAYLLLGKGFKLNKSLS